MSHNFMITRVLFLNFMLLLSIGASASEAGYPGEVAIDIVADDGRVFARYDLHDRSRRGHHRAYLEAEHGRNYGIRIRNNTGARIGLVIAVDGRNIISGKKSHLRSNEPMYVLGAYASATYDGWRTSDTRVHRFYFTDVEDSYADAWGDRSAIGVIAVAAFREQPAPVYKPAQPYREGAKAGEPAPSQAPSRRSADSAAESAATPGTGFGEGQHSQVVRVHFKPQPHAFMKQFLKYEWRETLVRLGIIPRVSPPNRFWPDYLGRAEPPGYAPYPPGYWNQRR